MNIEEGFNRLSHFTFYCGVILWFVLIGIKFTENLFVDLIFSMLVTGATIGALQYIKWVIKGFKIQDKR